MESENKKVIEVLKQLIGDEEKKILGVKFTDELVQKKLILFEIIRCLDTILLFQKDNESYVLDYQYGFIEFIRMFYGDFAINGDFPLIRSVEQTWRYANSVIQACGKIGYCRKIIDCIHTKLARGYLKNSKISIVFNGVGVFEKSDFDSRDWAKKLLGSYFSHTKIPELKKEEKEIISLLRKNVAKWKEHYIQYGAHPKLDEYYEKLAYYSLSPEYLWDEFTPESSFGGIRYQVYCDYILVELAVALKHYNFCLALLHKENQINPVNIITIPVDRKEMISSTARYMELEIRESEQILDCITLSPDNYEYHTETPGSIPPPFIRIGKNSLARSIIGSQMNPLGFLNRELKRRFPYDYFKAVNERENMFREQLYHFFSGDNFLKRDGTINIRTSKGDTDIDGVVYDSNAQVLALFQLKWQDTYGPSMKERYSKVRNLYPSIEKWIDKINAFLSETNNKELLRKLGFNIKSAPKRIHLFIICRHNAFFTGFKPDSRAAWTSIWQLLQAESEIPVGINNKIDWLFNLLKEKEKKMLTSTTQYPKEKLEIGKYVIEVQNSIR